jgi:hypothetical protein
MGNDYVSPGAGRYEILTACRFFVGGFAEILTVWMTDPKTASRDELLDQCTRLFLATMTDLLHQNV